MKNEIQKLVKDTRKLCRFLFKVDGKPAEIAPFQEEIISAMMWKKHERLIIWCSTQAGKSRATAMGLLLMAIIYPNERIVNISATNRQAMIMFDYIKEHIFDHSWITDSLTKFSMTTRDKFLSKLNRDKISFSEDTTISILSAEAGVPAGEGILGHTATILVVDESPSIRDDIYRTKVITRLGAKRDSSKMLIELGTAFSRNHFFDSWNDPDYHRIQVDWKRAVAENRLDYDFVMKQKDSMTPVEFAIWYECRLPEMLPNQFANWEWIQRAKAPQNLGTISGKRILGVDPATTGTDIAVLTSVIKGEYSAVVETRKFDNCSTMDLVSEIEKLDQKRNHSIINIDKTGLGEGVVDRAQELQALKLKVQGLHSHQAPSTDDNKKRFQNLKAEIYFNLRVMLEGGRIHIENDQKLIEQLANTFITHSQTYKTGVKYTGHGSADELDSLSLACYEPVTTKQIFWKPIAR